MDVTVCYCRLGLSLLFNLGLAGADRQPEFIHEFSTAKYAITMRVSFPPPYEGKRLTMYRDADRGKETCLSLETGASGCTEKFVGSVAVVLFTVNRIRDAKPAAASIREVVTVVDQSPMLPERPPFAMSIRLANGVGSDLQVFGYDESPAPPAPPVQRAAEREAAKAAWRHFRQALYMDKDLQPFAVIEWLHSTTCIRIVRVDAMPSPLQERRVASDASTRRRSHEDLDCARNQSNLVKR